MVRRAFITATIVHIGYHHTHTVFFVCMTVADVYDGSYDGYLQLTYHIQRLQKLEN